MTRQILYVAHPLAPSAEELAEIPWSTIDRGTGEYDRDIEWPISEENRQKAALKVNLQRALRWLAWLRKSFLETTFIAPWIAAVMSGEDDADPKEREAGLVDACAVVERCDGIVLCGGRISSGMRREMEHGLACNTSFHDRGVRFQVYDLVTGCPVPEGPSTPATPWIPFREWARRIA